MRIQLCFGIDDNYVPPFIVALDSVRRNTNEPLAVHILHLELSSKAQKRILNEFCSSTLSVQFHQINNDSNPHLQSGKGYISASTYLRLSIPKILEEPYAIYLDADILVTGNLGALWAQRTQIETSGAVADGYVNKRLKDHLCNLGLSPEDTYINSGVQLMNLASWRALNISQKAIDFLCDYPDKSRYADQDAGNVALRQHLTLLDPQWNTTSWDLRASTGLADRLLATGGPTKIVHFTGPDKPWKLYCLHPYRHVYRKHAMKVLPYREWTWRLSKAPIREITLYSKHTWLGQAVKRLLATAGLLPVIKRLLLKTSLT